MDIGKIDTAALENADLSLPADPSQTTAILKKGKGKTRFYYGCAKWKRKEWVGNLYPAGTKDKDFLSHYANAFNAIELNNFFYNLQPPQTVRNWKEEAGPGFTFCPKFPQGITHYKRLKGAEEQVTAFLALIREFDDALGPIFLMPHPQMSVAQLDVIEKFIQYIPDDVPLFLELRHPSWYTEGYNADLLGFLTSHKRGTIITDSAGRRDCVHMHLSTPECFIRFEGNALHKTDYTRVDEWVQRLKQWMAQGLERCYFFMHQPDEIDSPVLLAYFIGQMNLHCGTAFSVPENLG